MSEWTRERLENHITGRLEESLELEYKGAGALSKPGDILKLDVTKDVSAMANSAGGTIIYGIKEDSFKKYPESIDPVSRQICSKERLEHLIGNIAPKIDGYLIHALSISDRDVVYVVEIPQSTTAHQASDKRYYKRYNFESKPMDDYEIRDVMNRAQYPVVKIECLIKFHKVVYNLMPGSLKETVNLLVSGNNYGQRYAKYVSGRVYIPAEIVHKDDLSKHHRCNANGINLTWFQVKNLVQDTFGNNIPGMCRYEPILPGCKFFFESIRLREDFQSFPKYDKKIVWQLNADNAKEQTGFIKLGDLEVFPSDEPLSPGAI